MVFARFIHEVCRVIFFPWFVGITSMLVCANKNPSYQIINKLSVHVVWVPSSSGRFTCRSFRNAIVSDGMTSNRWKLLRDLLVPLKVKYFGWLLLKDIIIVRERLESRDKNICPIYEEDKEESRHNFLYCGRVYQVWSSVTRMWDMDFVGYQF